jgi:hypothetical protein
MSEGMQIQLPPNATLVLKTQDVVTILGALGEYGPHKVVNPIVKAIEQQLLAQQIKPEPAMTATEVIARRQYPDEIAHHPV